MLIPNIKEIHKKREEKGLTKSDLSRAAGLPPNALSRIESGKFNYTHPLRAKEIARALNCRVEDIFTETKGA